MTNYIQNISSISGQDLRDEIRDFKLDALIGWNLGVWKRCEYALHVEGVWIILALIDCGRLFAKLAATTLYILYVLLLFPFRSRVSSLAPDLEWPCDLLWSIKCAEVMVCNTEAWQNSRMWCHEASTFNLLEHPSETSQDERKHEGKGWTISQPQPTYLGWSHLGTPSTNLWVSPDKVRQFTEIWETINCHCFKPVNAYVLYYTAIDN